jgi:GNAT superfamily N-acetyltransferase
MRELPGQPGDLAGAVGFHAPAIRTELADPAGADAQRLIDALSAALRLLTGDDGRSRAPLEDLRPPTGRFVIARDPRGHAVGCGGLRVLDTVRGQIKRMYAVPGSGAGAAVLRRLEDEARALGLARVLLSTRRVNQRAVLFYRRHGYHDAAAFGAYAGRAESVCLQKELA